MGELLSVGTVVTVTEPVTEILEGRTYRALVRGYDLGGTKYNLGPEYAPGRFCDGGWWAFPSWVQAVDVADRCVFCEIVAGREPANYIRQWTAAVAIVPLEPVTDGHVLVIPRRHVRDASEHPDIAGIAMECAAEIAVPPYNIITSAGREATQSVAHLHVHIVPRREGDGLALPWHSGLAEPVRLCAQCQLTLLVDRPVGDPECPHTDEWWASRG